MDISDGEIIDREALVKYMNESMETASAKRLTETLRSRNLKLVLAESCTSGFAAAMLGGGPGVSDCFCGSAVTYRIDSKSQWLGIETDLIEAHTAESPETSLAMALGIFDRTPEANFSAAITGHLGPGAPPEKDGIVYVAVAREAGEKRITTWESFTLESRARIERQEEAAERMFGYIMRCINE